MSIVLAVALGVAPLRHAVHTFEIYAITTLVFAAVWTTAWFVFLQPLLQRYALTASVTERIEAAEGDLWKKVSIWFEAKKTLAVAFLMSLFAASKGAVDTTVSTVSGLQATDLAALQDKSMWSAFFGDIWSFHIIAAVSLLAAFLSLKGKVQAAAIVPAPATTTAKN